jgi:hypothetical protein
MMTTWSSKRTAFDGTNSTIVGSKPTWVINVFQRSFCVCVGASRQALRYCGITSKFHELSYLFAVSYVNSVLEQVKGNDTQSLKHIQSG